MEKNLDINIINQSNRTSAKFEKVSFDQFKKDWINSFPEDEKNIG